MSDNKYQVVVGICAYGGFPPETVASLLSLNARSKTPLQIHIAAYTYIHVARTNLLHEAIEAEATHLMFIDNDMTFPPDAIDRLIAQEKDIIGGLYKKRIEPHDSVVKIRSENRLIDPPIQSKTYKVDVIGTGFMLINMNVFNRMKPPFFYHGKGEEFGLKQNELYDLGEDTTFCLKARECGIDIWCDPTLDIGHIAQKIIK